MKIVLILTILATAPLLGASSSCGADRMSQDVTKAVEHINHHRDHGYKFKLLETLSHRLGMVDGVCVVELQLILEETVCPFFDPKPLEDCAYRGPMGYVVKANCTFLMSVNGTEANVTKYDCPVYRDPPSAADLMMRCVECPYMVSLNHEEGMRSLHAGVMQFNQNASNQHLYVLQDVGRLSIRLDMFEGMFFHSEFVLAETDCPMGSGIMLETCSPLCPDRATLAFCHLIYAKNAGKYHMSCELFPPQNRSALGPAEHEPLCTTRYRRPTEANNYIITCPGDQTLRDLGTHPICPFPVWPTPQPS